MLSADESRAASSTPLDAQRLAERAADALFARDNTAKMLGILIAPSRIALFRGRSHRIGGAVTTD
jgi:hypothetical protein